MQMIPVAAYKEMMAGMAAAGMDALFTNMDSYPRREDLHFGTGPVPAPNCHFDKQRSKVVPIVDLPEGKGLRMTVYQADLPRLLHSPVLSRLAPASGLMKGIMTE